MVRGISYLQYQTFLPTLYEEARRQVSAMAAMSEIVPALHGNKKRLYELGSCLSFAVLSTGKKTTRFFRPAADWEAVGVRS